MVGLQHQVVRGYVALGLVVAIVYHHGQSLESSRDDTFPRAYVLGGVAALQPQRSLLDTPKLRAVNLGGWLVIERWMKPSLFDGIPNGDLLDGALITLQSTSKGTFVSAEGGGGGQVVVNKTAASTWETFKIWRVSAGVFQFRVFNNMFVSAIKGGGGPVLATASIPSTWETFRIIRNQANPSKVHIQANNGMYLQAKNANQLTADFQGDPGWDTNDATFIMKVSTVLGGEYQLANGWGPALAPGVFKKHRDSFIVENDFQFLSQNGINAVRIPVGWWIASDPNPPAPYVSGSLQALDNAFQWANAHGIKVIIDLHAAPGSQNGQQHSSSRDGSADWAMQGGPTDYVSESIKTIDFLASRYAKNQALFAIELLNEPFAKLVPLNVLESYYKRGYSTVRKYTASAYVMMCQRIGGDYAELVNVLPADKVVLDIHLYNLFSAGFGNKTTQENIEFIYNKRLPLVKKLNTAGNALIFVGEWTNEWEVNGASKADYRKFGAAQLEVFGQATLGWAYWSYQAADSRWSFKQSVQQGYLPVPTDG